MTEKYKILAKFIKDMSSETPDIDTFLYVRDNISSYSLNIDIKTKKLKDRIYQVETTLSYSDKNKNVKKSFFEMIFATVIRMSEEIEGKDLARIVLCDLQKIVYPKIEKIFLDLIKNSGYPGLKFEKKVDFEKMYNEKFN